MAVSIQVRCTPERLVEMSPAYALAALLADCTWLRSVEHPEVHARTHALRSRAATAGDLSLLAVILGVEREEERRGRGS